MSVRALSYSPFFYIDFYLTHSLSLSFLLYCLNTFKFPSASLISLATSNNTFLLVNAFFILILYFMLYSLAPIKGVPFLLRQHQSLWVCLCDRSQDKINKTEIIKVKITTDCAWLSRSICCLPSPHREKPRLCWFQQISKRKVLGRFLQVFPFSSK